MAQDGGDGNVGQWPTRNGGPWCDPKFHHNAREALFLRARTKVNLAHGEAKNAIRALAQNKSREAAQDGANRQTSSFRTEPHQNFSLLPQT
jgi:hypothetical protein